MDERELEEWISEQREEGYSFEEIRDVLANEDISDRDIDRAIEKVKRSGKEATIPGKKSNKTFWLKIGSATTLVIAVVLTAALVTSGPKQVSIDKLSNSQKLVGETVKISGKLSSSNTLTGSGSTVSFRSCQEKSGLASDLMKGASGISAFFSDSGNIPKPRIEITGKLKQKQTCNCEMKINATEGTKWSSNTPYNVGKTLEKSKCQKYAEKNSYVTSDQNNLLPGRNFTVSDSRCLQTQKERYLACEKFNWKNKDEVERKLKERYEQFQGKVLEYAAEQN
ncbi:MAG: hypothetical protein H8Z69_00025 [Nanohaloarchaea archaeon]|nr:hypothetical protein [Candidatus Nanohaloarchaea archaeon]